MECCGLTQLSPHPESAVFEAGKSCVKPQHSKLLQRDHQITIWFAFIDQQRSVFAFVVPDDFA